MKVGSHSRKIGTSMDQTNQGLATPPRGYPTTNKWEEKCLDLRMRRAKSGTHPMTRRAGAGCRCSPPPSPPRPRERRSRGWPAVVAEGKEGKGGRNPSRLPFSLWAVRDGGERGCEYSKGCGNQGRSAQYCLVS